MALAAMRSPRSRTVALPDGRTLHALTWTGRGVPFVLLHGLLDSADGWIRTCRATRHPCVAFDLGGFGGSDLPRRPALSAYAEDVIAGLDALGVGDCVLVGHSLGGGVAAAVAERRPGQVRALVLLAPAGFGRIALAEAISVPGVRHVTERVLPFALGNPAAVATAYRLMIANHVAPSRELVDRVVSRNGGLVAGAREATKAVVRAGLSKRAFYRRRVGYDGPVTVVWGDHDRLVPIGHLGGVEHAFPQAVVHVWEGMGHHPQRERPAKLAGLLAEVMDAAERAPGVSRAA